MHLALVWPKVVVVDIVAFYPPPINIFVCECIYVHPRFVYICLCVSVCVYVCVCLAPRLVHTPKYVQPLMAWQGLAETERRGHATILFYSSLLMNIRKDEI